MTVLIIHLLWLILPPVTNGVATELFLIVQAPSSTDVDENSIEESLCEPDPVASSNIVASMTGAHKAIITSPREESLHKECCQWVKQRETFIIVTSQSMQRSSSDPLWSQKETLADGSKELSSSLITGHSREAIVDIDASGVICR